MEKILVTAATSQLGTEVVNLLVKKMNVEHLSVLLRDPAKAEHFKSKGVTIHKGDYMDYNSLLNAFKNVDKLYFISTGDMFNRETQHENVVKAAKEAKIKHIVYTSFQRKNETESSPINLLLKVHVYTDKLIKASGMTYTILRHGLYTDFLPILLGNQILETGVVFVPTDNGKVAFTLRSDLAAGGVAILTGKGHENKEYNLVGDKLYTFKDVASTLSKVSGKTISFVSPSQEEYKSTLLKAGVPEMYVNMFAGFSEAVRQGEFDLSDKTLSNLLGKECNGIEELLKKAYIK